MLEHTNTMESGMKRKVLDQFEEYSSLDYMNRGLSIPLPLPSYNIGDVLFESEKERDEKKVKLEENVESGETFIKSGESFEHNDSDSDFEDIDAGEFDTYADYSYDIKNEHGNDLSDTTDSFHKYSESELKSNFHQSDLGIHAIQDQKESQYFTLNDFKANKIKDEFDLTSIDDDIGNEEDYDEDMDQKPEWVEDDTIPEGWKRRILPGNVTGISRYNIPTLQSPCGRFFRTRHLALQWLIKERVNLDEIKEMDEKLVHEGWISNSLLPLGWKFRSSQFQRYQFLTGDAKLLKSLKEGTDTVELNYGDEDIARFKMFMEITSIEKRIENYRWEESCTIPEGWKVRIAEGKSGKSFYLSPDGHQFASRCLGLQHMVKNNFKSENIRIMMNKMVEYEDWEWNEKLPQGWLLRLTSSSRNFLLFTREGTILESFSTALEYLKLNSNYSEQDVENMELLITSIGAERRLDGYDWQDSDGLPKRWKIRTIEGNDKKYFILSPDGTQFGCRRNALKFMVENQYPEDEIEKMRKDLIKDGWEDDPLLPKSWKYRIYRDSGRDVYFLTETGRRFHGFKSAKDYLESDRTKFGQKDITDFETFCEVESTRRRTSSNQWNKEDQTIPEGWMSRAIPGGKELILSPEGLQFYTRRTAFQHLVRTDGDEEEIKKMRNCLQHEGWEFNEDLPMFWMFKQAAANASRSVRILSDDGHLFESFLTATDFLKANNDKYTKDDVEKMTKFLKNKSAIRRRESDLWECDDNLPNGWKRRSINGWKSSKTIYLSPEGTSFFSERVAYQHIVENGYDQGQVLKMQNYMLKKGWELNRFLPEGWMIRSAPDKAKNMILSSEGKSFDSYLKAVEYMKSNEKYTSKDVELIQEVISEKLAERTEKSEEWIEDKNLPLGWKTRITGTTRKQFFLGPDGQQFSSRRAALQHMIRGQFGPREIKQMKSCTIRFEGYEENKFLPEGWLVTRYKGSKHKLVSSDGATFPSFASAIEFMKFNEKYTADDIFWMEKVMEEIGKKRIENKPSWIEDKSLPVGWKMRVADGKVGQQFYLSPDGVQFPCKRASLQHMIKENYESLEIKEMRSSLLLDGWEFNSKLPQNWMYRETGLNKGKLQCHILSECGQLFESFQSAIEFLKSSSSYNFNDVQNMQNCLKEKSRKRSRAQDNWEEDKYVPTGWRSRILEGKDQKRIFLSSDGTQFNSGRAALQHMIQANYDKPQINKMRISLLREKWEFNPNLPKLWMYRESGRKIKTKISKGVRILSEDGRLFESFFAAMEFMRTDSRFTETDLQKLQNCITEKANNRRQLSELWKDDKNLPEGWRYRIADGIQGRVFYLAPTGEQFQSRKAVYRHLIKENYAEKDINVIKGQLISLEKWQEHPKLPSGWIFKESSADCKEKKKIRTLYGYNFLSTEGHYFEGSTKALEYLKQSPLYSELNLQQFNEFIPDRQALRRKTMDEWEDDKNLPAGWRFKVSGNTDTKPGKVFYLSPEGKQLQGRRLVYIQLLKEKYDEKDIETMKNLLFTFEKWQEHPSLPSGWIFREASATSKEKRKARVLYGFHFISSEGDYFEGNTNTMDFLNNSPLYSEYDLNSFTRFISEMQALRRKSMEDWEDDKNLPSGWRYKISKSTENTSGKIYYLSPDGTQFQGRKSVLIHLIKNNYAEAEVMKMRELLIRFEKWEENENLPLGWIFKEGYAVGLDRGVERTLHNYSFITREGEYFESVVKATEFVTNSENYEAADATKLSKLIPEKQASRRANAHHQGSALENNGKLKVKRGKRKTGKARNIVPKPASLAPHGWRLENGGVVSPDGRIFSSRLDAVKEMVAGTLDDEDLNDMRDCLILEGWKMSDDLPDRWKYKDDSSADPEVIFLSDEADILATVDEAKEYILSHTANKQQYLENIRKLTNFLKSFANKPQQDWESSEAVPDGWKIKISNPKHIMAPDGKQFTRLRQAIKYMVREGWRLEDLDSMRSKLTLYGWSLDPRLPDGWAMKINPKSDCIWYISSDGEDLRSTRSAVKYLQKINGSDTDVMKLKNLLKRKLQKI